MPRCIAIQWDSQALRIASADVADRVRVEELASLPITESTEPSAIREFVTGFVSRSGPARPDASLVIPRGQLELRVIEVPAAPDDELPDLVRYQAKSYFSAAAEGHVIDFIRLINGKDSSPIQVLAAALPNVEFKRIQSVFEPTKIRLRHMLPRPFALANVLRPELQAPKHCLLINRIGSEVDLTVTYRNRVVLTRTFRLPSASAEQASALVTEIRRTAAAASNQPGGGTLQKMLILGGTQLHREWAKTIGDLLHTPVEVRPIAELASLSSAAKNSLGDDDGAFGPLLGSLGLVPEPADHLIDFAQPHRRKEAVSDPRQKYRVAAIAGAGLLVVLAFVWFMIGSRRAELNRLESELRALSTNSAARDLLIGRVELIDRWKRGDVNWLDELYEISARFPLPDEAIVTQFSTSVGAAVEEGAINLGGMISESRVENAMVHDLRERPYNVTQGKAIPLDQNSTYSRSFDLRLTIPLGMRNVDQLLQPKRPDGSRTPETPGSAKPPAPSESDATKNVSTKSP